MHAPVSHVEPPRGAVRLRLHASDGLGTAYADLRGAILCDLVGLERRDAVLARLGPDPLRADADPDRAWRRISRSPRAIGDLLMDQSVVAGIGNVYRAEALFVAGIHPLRPGTDCDSAELEALWATAQGMLRQGVKDNRIVTVSRDDLGIAPNARIKRREATYAYKRDRCLLCGDEIRRIKIANRTSYHCPTHQPR